MYSCNKKNLFFNKEISTALMQFVEQENKEILLERIKFYDEMEELIKKNNTKYFIRILESEFDSVQFEISLNSFL